MQGVFRSAVRIGEPQSTDLAFFDSDPVLDDVDVRSPINERPDVTHLTLDFQSTEIDVADHYSLGVEHLQAFPPGEPPVGDFGRRQMQFFLGIDIAERGKKVGDVSDAAVRLPNRRGTGNDEDLPAGGESDKQFNIPAMQIGNKLGNELRQGVVRSKVESIWAMNNSGNTGRCESYKSAVSTKYSTCSHSSSQDLIFLISYCTAQIRARLRVRLIDCPASARFFALYLVFGITRWVE